MSNFAMRGPHIEKYFPSWHFSRKNILLFTVALKKENVAVCGYRIVVCRDLKSFQKSPVCVSSALWCVGDLKIYKDPLCMGSVL